MQKTQRIDSAAEALLGYAADARGNGLVYVRVSAAGNRRVLRLPFRVAPPIDDRAVAYAALTVVARRLRERGYRRVRFLLGDARFVTEVAARSELPETLVLPYVRLRCVLNSLEAAGVEAGDADELSARARAEVALNLAA